MYCESASLHHHSFPEFCIRFCTALFSSLECGNQEEVGHASHADVLLPQVGAFFPKADQKGPVSLEHGYRRAVFLKVPLEVNVRLVLHLQSLEADADLIRDLLLLEQRHQVPQLVPVHLVVRRVRNWGRGLQRGAADKGATARSSEPPQDPPPPKCPGS